MLNLSLKGLDIKFMRDKIVIENQISDLLLPEFWEVYGWFCTALQEVLPLCGKSPQT